MSVRLVCQDLRYPLDLCRIANSSYIHIGYRPDDECFPASDGDGCEPKCLPATFSPSALNGYAIAEPSVF